MMKNNETILTAMRGFGKQLIAETVTRATADEHIAEMQKLGYDGALHAKFSNFIYRNRNLKPQGDDLICWFGEILVDYIFLEAARSMTNQDAMGMCRKCNSCCLWPFTPPAFHLDQRPYTEAAATFWKFGYQFGRVEFLADKGKYDEIFDKILLWRTYYKEPFHAIRYGLHIRSASAYHSCRAIEKELNAGEEKKAAVCRARKALVSGWVENTARDRKTQTQIKVWERLATFSLAKRLQDIAESNYAIDFYPKEWGRQAAQEKTLGCLDDKTQRKLSSKLKGKRYQGWCDILSRLQDTHPVCFARLPSYAFGRRARGFVDPKLKAACVRHGKEF